MKSLLSKSLIAVALRIASAILAYASIIVLARWLPAREFGYWGSIISALTFLGVLCGLGLPMALLRFIPQDQVEASGAQTSTIIRYALRRTMRVTIGISVAAALLAFALILSGLTAKAGVAQTVSVVSLGLLLLPFYVLIDLNGAVVRSFGGLFWAIAPREVLWRLGLLPLVVIASTLNPSAPFATFMVMAGLSLGAMAGVQSWRSRMMVPAQPVAAPPLDTKPLTQVTRPIWMSTTANYGLSNLDILFVALMISPEMAAPYFILSRTASLLSFAHNAISVFLGPVLSRAYYGKDPAQAQAAASTGVVLAFLPALMAFGLFYLWGAEVLEVLDPKLTQHVPLLLILSVGHLFNAGAGPCGDLLNMTGHERLHAKVSTTMLLLMLLCLPMVIYLSGVLGAALVVSGLLSVQSVTLWALARRATGFDTSIFAALRILLLRRDAVTS
ncbi:lipopolysaccharide biosynthesis protein [Thalassobius sp. Cn5-15]|uniref:lipopolysaccharide biosynthesis protein n=1 Tax=Thalassobius sp. Cn5-15 TaxID=2917763 RepID=UPI001EF3836D|nr:lipopolysaccharide biosynthesis protein [Thalassobius sp. Cn5-15]MCG7495077.1 lipopolysaccharide biosynthesis protein [Thalassobius sp. Cn5-15]